MTRSLGGMEILGEINSGGMGEVLLARRLGAHGFEKLVAIKTIRPELSERSDIRDLFLDEARLVARIQHPSVTQVHDFGEEHGTLFLLMEYVQGVSLELLLEKHGALPAGIAAQIAQQACRGLHAAHELTDATGRSLGVVHRDVSPSNLLLTFDGGVKIIDFGIALMRDRKAPTTQVGRMRGKISYMAPEQITGEPVDRRTDVWGLSNVLFELLTGGRLRGKLELHEIADELDRTPPAPSSLANVPPALDQIVMRGLSRDPSHRFRDAREMARALETTVQELGGEQLEEFALRELTEEREAHQKKLATLLHGEAPASKKTRGPTLVASGATPPPEIAPTRAWAQPKRKPVLLLIAGGVVLGAVIGSLRPKEEDPPPVVAPKMIASDVPVIVEEPPPREPAPPRRIQKRVRRAEKPIPAAGHGLLTIGAHPYGVVVIDGRELGPTPLLRARITAGEHEIRLLDPATRALRSSRRITIQDGQHERVTFR